MTVITFYFAWFNHSMNLSMYRVDSLIREHNQSQIIQITSNYYGLNNSQVPFVETSCCNKTINIMHMMQHFYNGPWFPDWEPLFETSLTGISSCKSIINIITYKI